MARTSRKGCGGWPIWGLFGALGVPLVMAAGGCVLPSYSVGDQGGGEAASGGATGAGAAGGSTDTTGSGGAAAGGAAGGGGGMGGDATGGATTGGGGKSETTTTDSQPPCSPGHQCAPSPPAGWQYVRLLTLSYGDASVTPCPYGADPLVYYKDKGSSACKACNCKWLGAQCSEPEVSCYYGSASCGGAATFSLIPPGSSCVTNASIPLNGGQVASCQITKSPQVVSQGTCNAGGSTLVDPALWKTEVRTCPAPAAPAAGECAGTCVADGAGSFGGPLCLKRHGDLACPAGWSSKTVVYTSADDTRGCTSCGCGMPTTSCSMGVYNVFPGDGCAGAGALSFAEGTCKSVGSAFSDATRSIKPPIVTAGSTSTCFGGSPTGSLTPIDPWTLCCAP